MKKLQNALIFIIVISIIACSKDGGTDPKNLPTLTTLSISDITQASAKGGGNISSDGGASITAKGLCWSISSNPTTSNNKTNNGAGIASFTSAITGLSPNTTYYVKAYATNSAGTAYGNQVSFRTLGTASAIIQTTAITSITQNTATGGGNITFDGGLAITSRGVCWNTSGTPTIADNKTNNGTGTGSFVSNLTGLIAKTKYYVRAYATNATGTVYGDEVFFTTPCAGTVTDIDGNSYCTVTIGSQTWMTSNLTVEHYRNGDPITAYSGVTDWAYATSGRQFTFNINTYGTYYNWYAVNDSRGIAPAGWHVASKDEWNTLYATLGGNSSVAQKLKMGFSTWYGGGSNISGFSALPGGLLTDYAVLTDQGVNGYWWTSSSYTTPSRFNGIRFYLGDDNTMQFTDRDRRYGMPVRCVKD